ncbi:MAG: WD40 repeat domain-containing protein [Myxococcota bacterium]
MSFAFLPEITGTLLALVLPAALFLLTTELAERSMGWAALLAAAIAGAIVFAGLPRIRHRLRHSPAAAATLDAYDRTMVYLRPFTVLLGLVVLWEASSAALGIDSGEGAARSAMRVMALTALSLAVMADLLIAYVIFTRRGGRPAMRTLQAVLGIAVLVAASASWRPAQARVAAIDDAGPTLSSAAATVAVGEFVSVLLVAAWVWALPREAAGVALARSGDRFAVSRAGHLALHAAASGPPLSRARGGARVVAFGAGDGLVLTDRRYGILAVHDATTGDLVHRLADARAAIAAAATSHDGRLVAAVDEDRLLHVWEVESGRHILELPTGCALATSLAFTPDDAEVRVLNHAGHLVQCSIAGGKVVHQVEPRRYLAQAHTLSRTALSPDGRHFAGALAGLADASRPLTIYAIGGALPTPTVTIEVPDVVRLIAWSGDSRRVATGAMDRRVSVWDARTGASLSDTPPAPSDSLGAIALNHDGTRLAVAGRGPVRFVNV